jgi:hypothetical protein
MGYEASIRADRRFTNPSLHEANKNGEICFDSMRSFPVLLVMASVTLRGMFDDS